MPQRKKLSGLRKLAVVAGVAAGLAAAGHLGIKARVNSLNQGIVEMNNQRSALVAKEVPVELHYGRALRGKLRSIIYNPNEAGRCAAYTSRAAQLFFGKNYVSADAWNMPKANRVVFQVPFDRKALSGGISRQRLAGLIESRTITPGTIIGVFYPQSPNNRADRQFTHMMIYAGDNVFWHNFLGPKAVSLEEIYSAKDKAGNRMFFPVSVIEPAR